MSLPRLWLKDARRLIKRSCSHIPGLQRPEQIHIDITDRCNYRCPLCTKWQEESSEGELTTTDWKSFLDKAGTMSLARRVAFSGGEPLLRDDLTELVAHCNGLGCTTVVVSNGSLLNAARLRELDTAGLSYLMISLNSMGASVHDKSRGMEGSWEHLMGVIRDYGKARLRLKLGIATVLMATNLDGLPDLVDFVESQDLHGVNFQPCMDDLTHHPFRANHEQSRGSGWYEASSYMPRDHAAVDEAIDQLLAAQRRGARILNPPSHLKAMKAYFRNPADYAQIPCLAGVTSLLVDPYGDIRICFGLDTIANVRDQADSGDIWTSPAARAEREKAATCRRPCRILNHIY